MSRRSTERLAVASHGETFQLFGIEQIKNKKAFTPIHMAAWQGNVKIIKFLLDKGANVSTRNANNNTPLQSAACIESGHIQKNSP